MDKLIHLSENSFTRPYTSESEVKSIQLTAPYINLLPYEIQSKYVAPVNFSGAYTNDYGLYHFDFRNGLTNEAGRKILQINNVQNIVDFKPGKYTICLSVKNIKGTYNLGNGWCFGDYYTISTGMTGSIQLSPLIVLNPGTPDYIYNFVFDAQEDQLIYQFRFGSDPLSWSTTPRDLLFDVELIGLFQGEVSVQRQSNMFSEKPSISVSNSNNIVGEYKINTNILRHLNQIERHITSKDGVFHIGFR